MEVMATQSCECALCHLKIVKMAKIYVMCILPLGMKRNSFNCFQMKT